MIGHVPKLLAAQPELQARLATSWKGRQFSSEFARPHLLCAALHADALRSDSSPLAAAIRRGEPFAIGSDCIADALGADRAGIWRDLSARSVQANEIRRAICWRLPVHELARGGRGPFVLVDIGCSAGLNLIADRVDVSWTTTAGLPLQLCQPDIAARVGLDREPLDPAVEEDANWLRACLLPGARLTRKRLDTAIEAAKIAQQRRELELASFDLRGVFANLSDLSEKYNHATVIAYHTALLPFLDETTRWLFEDDLRSWTSKYGPRAVWAYLELATPSAPSVALHVVVDDSETSDSDLVVATMSWDCTDVLIQSSAVNHLRLRGFGQRT
jgi:hypothetical protein